MAKTHPRIALFLVFLLAFQSVMATGAVGCRHDAMSKHAGHEMNSTDNLEHAAHHHKNQGDAGKTVSQSGCTCGCYCAGTCLHACQGPSLIAEVVIMIPEAVETQRGTLLVFSSPGYTSTLFRPPAIS